jgi:hypothetical protein
MALTDTTRRRHNFDHHVGLRPALLEWYAALEMLLPGASGSVYQRVCLS